MRLSLSSAIVGWKQLDSGGSCSKVSVRAESPIAANSRILSTAHLSVQPLEDSNLDLILISISPIWSQRMLANLLRHSKALIAKVSLDFEMKTRPFSQLTTALTGRRCLMTSHYYECLRDLASFFGHYGWTLSEKICAKVCSFLAHHWQNYH